MGAIKDLVDLSTKLTESVNDRKFASELREIQRMIGAILSEQAEVHEQRMALMAENEQLKKKLQALTAQIKELQEECETLRNPPHTDPLTEEQMSILRMMVHPYQTVVASEISKKLGLSLAVADYQADLLRKSGFVIAHMSDGFPKFKLSDKGRKLLFEQNML